MSKELDTGFRRYDGSKPLSFEELASQLFVSLPSARKIGLSASIFIYPSQFFSCDGYMKFPSIVIPTKAGIQNYKTTRKTQCL